MVSVIIPTFNYGALIGDALGSIARQTLTDWECLIVDDGSTDDTEEVVRTISSVDPRFQFLQKSNAGPAAARNLGITRSSGKYIQFLDADDLLEARKLECHSAYLRSHPDIDIVYGSACYFTTEQPLVLSAAISGSDDPWMPNISGQGRPVLDALAYGNTMVISSPLVRRSWIDRVGGFDESLLAYEDWHYWIRCAAGGARFQFVDEPETRALVRSHPTSISRKGTRRTTAAAALEMLNTRPWQGADKHTEKVFERAIARFEGFVALTEVTEGNLMDAVRSLLATAWRTRQVKWALYALAAPVMSREHFQQFVRFSLRGAMKQSHR